jgi:uncharacterized membrane protein
MNRLRHIRHVKNPGGLRKWARWIVGTLPAARIMRASLPVMSLLGFLAALYLTLVHYRGGIPRCYVVEGCAIVQNSKYSAVLGIPIALPGALYFAFMFYLGIGLLALPRRRVVLVYRIVAFAGALAAVPLFLLQAVALRAYCTYCLVTEVVLVATWLVSLALRVPPGATGESSDAAGKPSNAG